MNILKWLSEQLPEPPGISAMRCLVDHHNSLVEKRKELMNDLIKLGSRKLELTNLDIESLERLKVVLLANKINKRIKK